MCQLMVTLPGEDVRVAIVVTEWDLCPSISAAIAPNHSDLRVAGNKQDDILMTD